MLMEIAQGSWNLCKHISFNIPYTYVSHNVKSGLRDGKESVPRDTEPTINIYLIKSSSNTYLLPCPTCDVALSC